jgi:hypothetical protein
MSPNKPYRQYNIDRKRLALPSQVALQQKIKSGSNLGGLKMAHLAHRERQENFKALEEAKQEQEALKRKKRARIGFRKGYRPYINFKKS